MAKVLITSALPYANGPLHFGHIAGAYLPGDAYARFQRLLGNDVLYICGSDEYGVAITMSADIAKRTPKEHVDIFHEINKSFFQQLDFSFDHYCGRAVYFQTLSPEGSQRTPEPECHGDDRTNAGKCAGR